MENFKILSIDNKDSEIMQDLESLHYCEDREYLNHARATVGFDEACWNDFMGRTEQGNYQAVK